jgi:hypothetical protein
LVATVILIADAQIGSGSLRRGNRAIPTSSQSYPYR